MTNTISTLLPITAGAAVATKLTSGGREYKSLNDFEASPLGQLDIAEMKSYECAIHSAMEHFGIKEHH